MAVAVRGARELDGHERLLLPIVELELCLAEVVLYDQQIVEHVLRDCTIDEIEDYYPLIVPADDPLHLFEEVVAFETWPIGADHVDHFVVELDEQQVEL
jgi:hypothetical protein